jgi:hypothetical protein
MIQRIDGIGLCTTSACARPMSQEWSRSCVATSVTRRSGAEIHEGLNVVETWNSANGFIFFGKGGEVASNRPEDEEVAVHADRRPPHLPASAGKRLPVINGGKARHGGLGADKCINDPPRNSTFSGAQDHDARRHRVHPPLSPARPAERLDPFAIGRIAPFALWRHLDFELVESR